MTSALYGLVLNQLFQVICHLPGATSHATSSDQRRNKAPVPVPAHHPLRHHRNFDQLSHQELGLTGATAHSSQQTAASNKTTLTTASNHLKVENQHDLVSTSDYSSLKDGPTASASVKCAAVEVNEVIAEDVGEPGLTVHISKSVYI